MAMLVLAGVAAAGSVGAGLSSLSSPTPASAATLQPPVPTEAFNPATIPLNGTSTVTFTITNPNDADLTGLSFTDNLNAGLDVSTPNGMANTCNDGGVATATAGSTTISLTGDTLPGGASCSVSVNVTGLAPGTYTNSYQVIPGNAGASVIASATLTVTSPVAVSQAATTNGPEQASADTLTFSESNTIAITNFTFSDTLPSSLAIGSISCPGGSCSVAGQTVSWTVAALPQGGSSQLVVPVSVNTCAPATNVGTFSYSAAGETVNGDSQTVVLDPWCVTLTKSASSTTPGQGSQDTFNFAVSFAVTNQQVDPESVTGGTITDVLPNGLSYVSSTSPACVIGSRFVCISVSGQTVTWNNINLNVDRRQLNVAMTVALNTCSAIDNTATLSFTQPPTSVNSNVVTLTPQCVTLSVSGSQSYGSSNPAFTYTSSQPGVGLTGNLVCTTEGGGTTIAPTLPVDTYTVDGASCSGLTPPEGYVVNYVGVVSGFAVSQVPLVITASSPAMTYGSTPPAITPSYSAFVNGEGAGALTTQPSCTTTATSASLPGGYPTSCSGAVDPNYSISYVPGTLTVSSTTITITVSGSETYGGNTPSFTFSASPNVTPTGQLTCTEVWPVVGKQPLGIVSPTPAAGSYTIDGGSCSGLTAPAGYTIQYVGADSGFVVNPAPLTVTASPGSMTYGGSLPVITPQFSGLVNGDTAASLTSQPTCDSGATVSTPAGVYPSMTSCSGAADPNYTLTYVNGTLTVSKDATTTVVTPNIDPSFTGEAVTLTANVSANAPGSGVPTGGLEFVITDAAGNPVAFTCAAGSDTVQLVAASAICTVPAGILSAVDGPYAVKAMYLGDNNFISSVGSTTQDLTGATVTVVKSAATTTPADNGNDTFTLTAADGAAGARSGKVVVTDALAGGLVYRSSSSSVGTIAVSGQTVTWTIPDLEPGASATMHIVVTVETTSRVENAASFTQAVPNASGGTTGKSNTVTLTPVYAELTLRSTVSNPTAVVGTEDTFSITVANTGADNAQQVVVTDPLPAGLSFVSLEVPAGTAHETSVGGVQTVVWSLGTLAVGTASTMQVVVTVTAQTGTVVDPASATDVTYDPTGQVKQSSASVVVTAPTVVPSTHTGEPWAGWPYWALLLLLGTGGVALLEVGRRRRIGRSTES